MPNWGCIVFMHAGNHSMRDGTAGDFSVFRSGMPFVPAPITGLRTDSRVCDFGTNSAAPFCGAPAFLPVCWKIPLKIYSFFGANY